MRSLKPGGLLAKRSILFLTLTAMAAALTTAIACGGGETVIQTVEVEKIVEVEKEVVREVEVEKVVEVAGETVVQTVEVEKVVEVAGETVVEVVEVEKIVESRRKSSKKSRSKKSSRSLAKPSLKSSKSRRSCSSRHPNPSASTRRTSLADAPVNEWPTIYDENGNLFPKPSSFKEAPMLAERVAAGELPPVEERSAREPVGT